MMRAVVAVVCLASAGAVAIYTRYSSGGTGEPVYTVPARAADPAPTPPASTAPAKPVDPTDRAALARALQRELKRVGCYHGEITGVWTTSSRMAMRTFTERVNAALPVDTPDPVLLSLVQGHRDRACNAACPPGQTPTEAGACLPAVVAAKAGRTLPDVRPEAEKPADAPPAAGAAAAAAGTAAALALAAPGPARTDPKGPALEPKAAAPASPRPAAATPGSSPGTPGGPGSSPGSSPGSASGPVPPEGMARDRRPRRSAEAPPPRPPKVVRDVLRALGFK